MKRRTFLLALGALAAPHLAYPQPIRVHRVAWLSALDKAGGGTVLTHFVEGMAALGYAEGRNLLIDSRWGDNLPDTLDRLALEAAALKPAVFVTQGPAVHSARKTPGNTPVVFGFSGDPVEAGIVKSLGRPGGRFTGISFLAYELVGKRVELLREVLPKARRLAVLANPNHPGEPKEFAATRDAAAPFGMELSYHPARNAAEIENAFAAILEARSEAVMIPPDGLMVRQREAIARFSIQHKIPTISGWAAIAEAGNLMTYGPVLRESYRRLAYFVDRILRGADPANMPVELPTKLELVINMRTAKALGLTIPQSVLVRADRVIQ